jgi:hypothetical protein
MGRFQVRIVNRHLAVVVYDAERAYQWLDEHAQDGDSFVIMTVHSDGTLEPVVEGDW